MGNMSKMTTTIEEEEEEDFECCICYEQKKFKLLNDSVVFNGLRCERTHKVCFACLNKLLNECGDDNCKCIGYNWKCPCCRQLNGIGRASQLIGVISGSWKKVNELTIKHIISLRD